MRSHWQEPFLWIHAAGILILPFWVGLTLIGLATGDPLLPVGVEQAWVAVVGIGPVFALQWRKPLDIFSLWVASVPPGRTYPRPAPHLGRLPQPRTQDLDAVGGNPDAGSR